MSKYTFETIIQHIGQKLNTTAHKEDVETGEVELLIGESPLHISKGAFEGSCRFEMHIAHFDKGITPSELERLAHENYLGVETGGCSLCLGEDEKTLVMHATTTAGMSPETNWEWFERLVGYAFAIAKELTTHERVEIYLDTNLVPSGGPSDADTLSNMIRFKA